MELVVSETPLRPPRGTTPEVWRDNDGAVAAYGWVVGDVSWMTVPGVGVFRFALSGGPVRASPDPAAPWSLVEDAYQRNVLPMVLQVRGREVLHASAVQTASGIVALCARSGVGKSTLAYALSRRGHALWADDAVAFDGAGAHVIALPLPFRIRLRPPSAAHFGVPAWSPDGHPAGGRSAPLGAVCVLERASVTEVRRIPPAQAFSAVLPHAYCFSLADQDRRRAMMRHYLDLVARVPVYAVRYPAGLAHVPVIANAIEQTLPWPAHTPA